MEKKKTNLDQAKEDVQILLAESQAKVAAAEAEIIRRKAKLKKADNVVSKEQALVTDDLAVWESGVTYAISFRESAAQDLNDAKIALERYKSQVKLFTV